MKRLGMIFGTVAVLLGGTAAGYVFFPTNSAFAGEEKPAANSTTANPSDPIYVDLAPLVLPVIAGNNVEQVVQITITIEVADESHAERVRGAKPRLADAFVQDLYGALDRNRVMDGKTLDVTRLRDELTRASIVVLGANSFNKVLIQRIAQRTL